MFTGLGEFDCKCSIKKTVAACSLLNCLIVALWVMEAPRWWVEEYVGIMSISMILLYQF